MPKSSLQRGARKTLVLQRGNRRRLRTDIPAITTDKTATAQPNQGSVTLPYTGASPINNAVIPLLTSGKTSVAALSA